MPWFSRARLLVLTLICLFWTGLIFLGHFFSMTPFLSVPWRGEQSFEDLLRKEGRKTTPPRDFVFLGIDQSTLQLPPLTPEELASSRGLQLLSERPYPWSRELWALLLDRLFAAGARVVMFDLVFNPPDDGDPALHAALAPDGHAILSGILLSERDMMLSALSTTWRVVDEDNEDAWWSTTLAPK